eukprot:gene10592-biopygen10609
MPCTSGLMIRRSFHSSYRCCTDTMMILRRSSRMSDRSVRLWFCRCRLAKIRCRNEGGVDATTGEKSGYQWKACLFTFPSVKYSFDSSRRLPLPTDTTSFPALSRVNRMHSSRASKSVAPPTPVRGGGQP